MKKYLAILIIFFFTVGGVLFIRSNSFAKNVNSSETVEKEKIEPLIEQLKSKNWRERDKVVAKLTRFKENEKVKIALINLLSKEQSLIASGKTDFSGEYYLNLVAAVVSLNDKRAIPVLVDAVECGNAVQKALAKIGEQVIQPLINRFNSGVQGYIRASIISTLDRIVKKGTISDVEKTEIKTLLGKALRDENPSIRKEAVQAVGDLVDINFIPTIKKLATEDPYVQKRTIEGPKEVYPVREEAKKVWKKLKAKKEKQKKIHSLLRQIGNHTKSKDVNYLIELLQQPPRLVPSSVKNVIIWELGNIGDEKTLPVLYDILPDKAIKLETFDTALETLAAVAIVRIQNRKKSKTDQIAALLELWQQRSELKNNRLLNAFDSEVAYAISKMDMNQLSKELLKYPWPGIELLRQSISKMPKKEQIQTLIEFIEHTRENPRRAQYAIHILTDIGKPALAPLLATLTKEKYQNLSDLTVGTPIYAPYTNLLKVLANIATPEDLPKIQAPTLNDPQRSLIEKLVVEPVKQGTVIPYEYKYILSFH